ncbi:MAG: type II 3-dehydroquinate dehydratase [Actinomycetota bacterium]|nr:type II 3-dehydroquinate dehydratase [Actinomycetota bacterium]
MKVFVLNGPSLNLLGTREPEVYGHATLADVEAMVRARAEQLGMQIEFRQSNIEGEIISWLHEARDKADAVVLNPAAFTHYSIAIRDAVVACGLPVIEVHISNVFAREPFRAHSVVSPVARGVIVGLGVEGYVRAIEALAASKGEQQHGS